MYFTIVKTLRLVGEDYKNVDGETRKKILQAAVRPDDLSFKFL